MSHDIHGVFWQELYFLHKLMHYKPIWSDICDQLTQ